MCRALKVSGGQVSIMQHSPGRQRASGIHNFYGGTRVWKSAKSI